MGFWIGCELVKTLESSGIERPNTTSSSCLPKKSRPTTPAFSLQQSQTPLTNSQQTPTHRRTGHFLEGRWIDFARKIWDSQSECLTPNCSDFEHFAVAYWIFFIYNFIFKMLFFIFGRCPNNCSIARTKNYFARLLQPPSSSYAYAPTPQILLTATYHFSWHFTCRQLRFFLRQNIQSQSFSHQQSQAPYIISALTLSSCHSPWFLSFYSCFEIRNLHYPFQQSKQAIRFRSHPHTTDFTHRHIFCSHFSVCGALINMAKNRMAAMMARRTRNGPCLLRLRRLKLPFNIILTAFTPRNAKLYFRAGMIQEQKRLREWRS